MMKKAYAYHYEVLHKFSDQHYRNLFTKANVISDRTPIKLNKDTPMEEVRVFYIMKRGAKKYALPQEAFDDLPILVHETVEYPYYRECYDIITDYSSAKFKAVRAMSFRQLVDEFIAFEHSSPTDFKLWRIMALGSYMTRMNFRVSSLPAFGKDSAVNVMRDLLGDVAEVQAPSIAKLALLLSNKTVMINEVAGLKADKLNDIAQFLLDAGSMKNIYTKPTRVREGDRTGESINIGDLSVIVAYNDKECYQDGAPYFDTMFEQNVKERFIPFKFQGRMTEVMSAMTNPEDVAMEHGEYLKSIIRTIMYYKSAWKEEVDAKADWNVKVASDYGLKDRWASNFNSIRQFIILYSKTAAEAQSLLDVLYNRHCDYLLMTNGRNTTLSGDGLWVAKVAEKSSDEIEQLTVIEETVNG